jgi:cephalosporin-C deacetylase-like acetyl esterase
VSEEFAAYLLSEVNATANRSARRRRAITPESLPAYQAVVRERLNAVAGTPPVRPPLRDRVTGVLEREGFRVEKVVFESRVDFPVTANLYLPAGASTPVGAVLFPGTASVEGKAYPSFHAACQGLARLGFAALIYDLAGTGERGMYLDPNTGEETVPRGAPQLAVDAARCLLVGRSLASWHLWDGVRALDYLLTRPEIDPERIACAGHDETALLAAQLAAIDDRIRVVALGGELATWSHRLRSGLPADAALELFAPEVGGIDVVELLTLLVPRPLLLTAVRDASSPPDGVREIHAHLQPLYAAVGRDERLALVEVQAPHGFSRPPREEMYAWVTHHLASAAPDSVQAPVLEPAIEAEAEESLWCVAKGQILASLGSETVARQVFQLSAMLRKEGSGVGTGALPVGAPVPTAPRSARTVERIDARLQETVRDWLRRLAAAKEPDVELESHRALRPGTRTSLRFRSEPEIELTGDLILPPAEARGVVLWIPGEGCAATEERIQAMTRLSTVLALEPRGWRSEKDSRPESLAVLAMLQHRPLLGMQLTDVVAAVHLLKLLPETRDLPLTVHGTGAGGILAVMAGALVKEIGAVEMEAAPLSYHAYLRHPHPTVPLELVVPGAEPWCDLPAIAGAVAPRGMVLIAPRDAEGRPATLEAAVAEYELTARLYDALGAQGRFHIDIQKGARSS